MKTFLAYFYGSIIIVLLATNAALLWRVGNDARVAEVSCLSESTEVNKKLQDIHNALPKDMSKEIRDIQEQVNNITPAEGPEKI